MTEFIRVNEELAEELSVLASAIVKEHYDPILGAQQNDYMIRRFQSTAAISEQLKSGYQYYFIMDHGVRAGFFGYYPKEQKIYLSKLYIQKEHRGKHLAHDSIEWIKKQAAAQGFHQIFLNVNRYNADSIAAYEKMGFVRLYEEDNPIGHGYYMNDYVMELSF